MPSLSDEVLLQFYTERTERKIERMNEWKNERKIEWMNKWKQGKKEKQNLKKNSISCMFDAVLWLKERKQEKEGKKGPPPPTEILK